MSFHEFAIPIASILVPLGTLFVVRSLDKGEKRKSKQELDLYHIQNFVERNTSVIDTLCKDVQDLDHRLRRTELDLNRIIGRMNGRRNHNDTQDH